MTNRGRCRTFAVIAIVLLHAAAPAARADAPQLHPAQAPPEAMAHFERGREHFRAGRYREAVVELKAALALDPSSPTLVYNVAFTHELLGEHDQAIAYYERYLRMLPAAEAREREKTQITLRRLEGRRAELRDEAAASGERTGAGDPGERGIGRADGWFWASLGGGAALFAGAAATGLLALEREDAAAAFTIGRDGSAGDRQGLIDDANRLALASDLLVIGGAALVTTAALLFLVREPRDDALGASVATDGRSGSFVLHGRF